MSMKVPAVTPQELTGMRSAEAPVRATEGAADSELAFLRSRSMTTVIEQKIEQMILDGQLLAGQRLNELALAQQLGVSRSPIREACRKLEQAGLVQIINNRGMFVRSVDLKQALDIYDIRAALGLLSGQLLARHATDQEIDDLRSRVRDMEAAVVSGDSDTYYRLNLEFHRALVSATHNPRLAEMFLGTDKELHLYRQRSLVSPSGMSVSNKEHRAIVEAVRHRNEAAAGEAFRRHVMNGRERAIQAATPPGSPATQASLERPAHGRGKPADPRSKSARGAAPQPTTARRR